MKTLNKPLSMQSVASSILLLLLLLITACSSSSQQEQITSVKIKKGLFQVTIPAHGELQAVQATPITVPINTEGPQTIAWLASENTVVKKDNTVIRLDDKFYLEEIKKNEFTIAKLDLEIKQKEKQLNKERSELEKELKNVVIERKIADTYAARDENLFSRQKIIEDGVNLEYLEQKLAHFKNKKSQLEEKSRAELQLLELKKKTAQVRVNQLKSALAALDIKAPHDGFIIYNTNRRGERTRVGMIVWQGMELGKLPDLSTMEAKLYVLESEAGGLAVKQPVTISLDSFPGIIFKGTVTVAAAIAQPLDQESLLKYFDVKVALEKTVTQIMRPGNQVKGLIYVYKQENVLAIPNQAIFFDKGKPYVNVKTTAGTGKRPVETGFRSLNKTIITKGLNENDDVLLGEPTYTEEENQ